jgi:hypothetical protein
MKMSLDFLKTEKLTKQLQFLGAGGTRKAFLSKCGKWVFKIPTDDYGDSANYLEARDWEHDQFVGREHLAKCMLINIHGCVCLMMEYVEPILWKKDNPELPEWTGYIDCCQVGYNLHGKLVAYDWAT